MPAMNRWAAAIIVVLLLLAGCGGVFDKGKVTFPSTTTSTSGPPPAWVPSGWKIWSREPGLAFSFDDADSAICPRYAASCLKVAVVSTVSCPGGIYVAVSDVDANGNVVGTSNEISGGARAGDRVLIAVASSLSVRQAPTSRVSEINCLRR